MKGDLGIRFWDVGVPLEVIRVCAGNPMLLAAWVNIAAMELQDRALGRETPSLASIAAAMNMDMPTLLQTIRHLVDAGLLVRGPNNALGIPRLELHAASLIYARRLQEQSGVLGNTAPSSSAMQQALLFGDEDI